MFCRFGQGTNRKDHVMRLLLYGAALSVSGASVAHAEVSGVTDTGFVSRNEVTVAATPAEAWQEMVAVNRWWSSDHTYSGDAGNLYLDPQATGCFCEKLPVPKDAPAGQRMGSIEHAHYVRVQMAELRKKLEDDSARPRVLITEPGVGYRWLG